MSFLGSSWIVRWLRLRIWEPFLSIMRRGSEPKILAMSSALGITLGVFPIYGVTALICACTIALLGHRCNAPTMMLANLVSTPIEVILVVPFLRVGEWLVNGEQFVLSKDAFRQLISGKASHDVLVAIFHAILGWTVTAPFIFLGLVFAILPFMKCSLQRYGAALPITRSVSLESGVYTPLIKDALV